MVLPFGRERTTRAWLCHGVSLTETKLRDRITVSEATTIPTRKVRWQQWLVKSDSNG